MLEMSSHWCHCRRGAEEGGKNPLQTVLMIAVLVVANAYGAELAASFGYSGAVATSVASTAIAVTGSIIVSALVRYPIRACPMRPQVRPPQVLPIRYRLVATTDGCRNQFLLCTVSI